MLHDLPGVGEHLQDHLNIRMAYRCKPHVCTMNEVYHNWLRRIEHGMRYVFTATGVLMTGASPIGLFIRTRPELASPNVQYQFLAGSAPKAGGPMHRFPGCSVVTIPCRPESRGWLRIASPDPEKPPAIQPNYLSTRGDCETMLAAMKVARAIFATRAMREYVAEEMKPGEEVTSDEALLNHVRETGGTTYHPTSTCMMGPGPMAVVDTSLRVKGLEGLRVADASIMPTLVSGNTNAAVVMIAEKAADAILQAA